MDPRTGNPMNLTCSLIRGEARGEYEYRIIIDTEEPVAVPSGWEPLPDFLPDAGDKYHVGGKVDCVQKDHDLTSANMGVFRRKKG